MELKDRVTKEIIDVTATLTRVRKEIRLCGEFYDDVPKMKEQLKELNDKEKQKIKEKNKEKIKEKKKKTEDMIGRGWYRNVSVLSLMCSKINITKT